MCGFVDPHSVYSAHMVTTRPRTSDVVKDNSVAGLRDLAPADRQGRRVNIYIPQPLAARLDAVRGRVNLSKVCQDAIETAVAAEERIGTDERKSRVVRRLLELDGGRTRHFRQGFSDGQSWAESTATWPYLKEVAAWGKILSVGQLVRRRPRSVEIPGAAAVAAVEPTTVKLYLPASVPPPPKLDSEDKLVMYWRGFRDGVQSVHELVKDAFEAPAPKVSSASRPKTTTSDKGGRL